MIFFKMATSRFVEVTDEKIILKKMHIFHYTKTIIISSIYSLSDLGVSSNLIGSLSRSN